LYRAVPTAFANAKAASVENPVNLKAADAFCAPQKGYNHPTVILREGGVSIHSQISR